MPRSERAGHTILSHIWKSMLMKIRFIIGLISGALLFAGCELSGEAEADDPGEFEAFISGDGISEELAGNAMYTYFTDPATNIDLVGINLIDRMTIDNQGIAFTGREVTLRELTIYDIVRFDKDMNVADLEPDQFFAIYIKLFPEVREFESVSGTVTIEEIDVTDNKISGSFEFDADALVENTEEDSVVTVFINGTFRATEGELEMN